MLSIVLPAYNEEKNITQASKVIGDLLKENNIPYELVFVNDGSSDNTQEVLDALVETDPNSHYVMFTRNFGKEAAIFAGLATAKGDCVVVMDCDLQHPPEKVIEMYRKWEDGYEVVECVKEDRGKESLLHKLSAGSFYWLISKATNIDMANASDFKLLDRRAVDSILSVPEYHVFFRALSSWIGYKKTTVPFVVQERLEGSSKWSTKSLIKYALNNLAEYSAAPLYITLWAGIIVFIISVILGIQTLINYFSGHAMTGFTTVILLQLFTASILMIGIGIVGFYLAKIYDEVKKRPRYLISKMK